MSSPTGGAGAPAARWPGYAAAVWGLVFAAPSFYWGDRRPDRRGIDHRLRVLTQKAAPQLSTAIQVPPIIRYAPSSASPKWISRPHGSADR